MGGGISSFVPSTFKKNFNRSELGNLRVLPVVIIKYILSYVNLDDLFRLSLANKSQFWRADSLWTQVIIDTNFVSLLEYFESEEWKKYVFRRKIEKLHNRLHKYYGLFRSRIAKKGMWSFREMVGESDGQQKKKIPPQFSTLKKKSFFKPCTNNGVCSTDSDWLLVVRKLGCTVGFRAKMLRGSLLPSYSSLVSSGTRAYRK